MIFDAELEFRKHTFQNLGAVNNDNKLLSLERKDSFTVQKVKLSIKDLFSKCDQIRKKLC